MQDGKYAVVRSCGTMATQAQYKFTKFHDTLELAKDEAMRLSILEDQPFLVLRVVGVAKKRPVPVEWEDL